MSFIAHGLKCDSCGEKDAHVFYRKSDGPPPCPSCGGSRSVDWTHGKFPGVQGDGIGSFTPVDMGVLGHCDPREKYDRAVAVIKERFPGHSVNRVVESKSEHGERIDAIRQRSWQQKKDNHLTPKIIEEVKEKSNAKARGASARALSLNRDPAKAAKTARQNVGSAAKNVGGWGT